MTQIPQAIAWTLIHFCWQAIVIAAGYRVLSIAIARRSSQTRYLVALSALLLMDDHRRKRRSGQLQMVPVALWPARVASGPCSARAKPEHP